MDEERLQAAASEAAGGAFQLFWGGGLATVLSAVCAILVARLLGPELYGVYSLALVVSGFLMLYTDYGVSQALTRFIALHLSRGEDAQAAPLLRTGLAFNMASSIGMFLVGVAFTEPLTRMLIARPEMVNLVRLTLLLILLQPISTAAGYALLGFGDMKGYALIDVARQLIRALLSPLLILLGFSVPGALAGYVSAYAVGAAVSLLLIYRHRRRIRGSKPAGGYGGMLSSMIAYGMPLYLANTLNSFLTTLRGIILAYYTTEVLIGNFNTAMNFAVLITLLSSPVATALFPAFSRLKLEEAKAMFTYSVKYTAALIIPAAVYVSAMSPELVYMLYGESYTYAPAYLTLYALIFLFAALGSTVLGSFFSGIGDSKVNLKATLLSAIVFAPAAPALTSRYSVEGLILALMLTTAASTLYSLWVARRRYGVKIDLEGSIRICLAALMAAAPLLPLKLYMPLPRLAALILGGALYTLTYLTLMPLLRILNRRDLEAIAKSFSGISILKPIINALIYYEDKIISLATHVNR